MLKIYGSLFCPDCVKCIDDLDRAGIQYEYLDFADSLRNLKEFLAIRDKNPAFAKIRESGKIGIPCIVGEDGDISMDWEDLIR